MVVIGLDIALGQPRPRRLAAATGAAGRTTLAAHRAAARALLPASPAPVRWCSGLLWGWLPCGLVYSALVAAAVAGSA